MNYLNSADLACLEPHLDAVWVKRGPGKEVLDDSSGQFAGGLVLFEDNGNVGSWPHVSSVTPIHSFALAGNRRGPQERRYPATPLEPFKISDLRSALPTLFYRAVIHAHTHFPLC